MPITADKRDRHRAILELVDAQPVASQEELRRLLTGRGWDVTQSTLSRDLHELRLARVPTGDGVRYAATNGTNGAPRAEGEHARSALETLLPQFFARIDGVGELAVVHTVPGGAQPVAVALDAARWPEIMGTIGGDDTILIVCRSADAREQTIARIRQIAGR
jgi:transcriptional regulator of arginine metabolism